MGTERLHAASQLTQHGLLAQRKAVVQYQSQTRRHLVAPHDSRLDASQVVHLTVNRVVVVAHAVAVGEERLARILGADDARLHIVVVAELVAQPVFVAVAGITVAVAASLVGRNATVGHQLVATVAGDLLQRREPRCRLLANVKETPDELTPRLVQGRQHPQLVHRLHRTETLTVLHELLHLQRRQERQRLPVVARHPVQVARLRRQLLHLQQQLLPVAVRLVLSVHDVHQHLLPGHIRLWGRRCRLRRGEGRRPPQSEGQ